MSSTYIHGSSIEILTALYYTLYSYAQMECTHFCLQITPIRKIFKYAVVILNIYDEASRPAANNFTVNNDHTIGYNKRG